MNSPNHKHIHRPKQHQEQQQPHAALLIILMSSICKLPKTLTDNAAGNLATAILSSLLLHLQNIYQITAAAAAAAAAAATTADRRRHHCRRRHLHHYYHNQHNNNSTNQNNNTNRNSNSINSQHAQIQQSSPSHERIVVKPNLLATNLVNTLMISLYITLFVSLSIYPVSVVAVTPKYETAYACEEKTLTIGCEPGYVINLIRANYGRFSITICNDQGNVDWSVNCMSAKSLRVLYAKCSHKQNCSILASTNTFGDPCPGTHKYLEAHYQCVSASQATSTTARPSPAWLITSQPSVWGTSTIRYPTTARIRDLDSLSTVDSIVNRHSNFNVSNKSNSDNGNSSNKPSSNTNDSLANRSKSVTQSKVSGIPFANNNNNNKNSNSNNDTSSFSASTTNRNNENASVAAVTKSIYNSNHNIPINLGANTPISSSTFSAPPLKTLANSDDESVVSGAGAGGGGGDDDRTDDLNSQQDFGNGGKTNGGAQSMNTINNNAGAYNDDTSGLYCASTTARNLFWNYTRVGDINVQPCPPGSTGIAKWRCSGTLLPTSIKSQKSSRNNAAAIDDTNDNHMDDDPLYASNTERGYMWQPSTPDLTQCRSLWLNSLEVRVNQRDSALVSIANDLSQVTNSKTLYGGDMLVTTKIIQSLCEKMTYDIETFSDQRQRESVVLELLNSVVKTGSNLLDETQQYSWMDLSFEDQMRVATSLLTGLEDNAFLLADTIAAERNVVQKVKNILLSVRVLETRNIVSNQVFPDRSIEQESNNEDSIELPRGALLENSEGGLVRIVFVAFDRLESILRPLDSGNEPKSYDSVNNEETIGPSEYAPMTTKESVNTSQSQPPRVRILNSKVISASLGKGRHIQLSQPIRLILKHLQTDNVTNPTCVFWNYIDHAWSEDGCHIDQTNRTHTICMCNHLTNFAILMDVIDDTAQFIQQIGLFDENMRILISISIAICIVFVVIALLTLKFFNGIFIKSNRTTIYKNLYICLLVTELLIWLGTVKNESSLLCGFTTAFLHCAFLCTISWTFLEGLQSYIVLTTEEILLDVENSSRVISYYLIAYGLSFTIVAISLGIDPSAYTIKADACVWMEQSHLFYITFVMPCCVYILANLAYIVTSAFVLCKKHKTALKNKEHTRLANIRFHLHGSFIFQIIFVACWVCAYMYMVSLHQLYDSIGTASAHHYSSAQANITFYGYGFVVLNIIQGAFIMCYHCLQNERIRREYQKFVRDSWLPQCLQCAVPANEDQSTASPANNALSANVLLPASNTSTKKKNGPVDATDVAGTFLTVSPAHHAHGQTSTLMRHHQMQRHNAMPPYSGTLREHRSGTMSPAGSSKYAAGGHKYQYDFQNPELIYPHSANSQQFHQLHDDHAKMMYYDRKMGNSSKTLKSQGSSSTQQMLSSPMKHDYSYWTGTADPTSYQLNKLSRHPNDVDGGGGGGEMMQAQGQYPSYRKKMIQQYQQQTTANPHSPSHPNMRGTFGSTGDFNGRNDNRNSWQMQNPNPNVRHGRQHQQQQQQQMNPADPNMPQNYNSYADEEPVYEEIMSRTTENCDGSDLNEYPQSPTRDSDNLLQNMRIAHTNSTHKMDASSAQQQQPLHSRSVQSQQEPKHPPQIGRNISAMLNENNTVVCYLEPLPNS